MYNLFCGKNSQNSNNQYFAKFSFVWFVLCPIDERNSVEEKIISRLLSLLLPPQADNENAADYLRMQIGQNSKHVEWVAVRPDTLINEENVSEYSLHKSPTRSAIFNSGNTSRINVADFMTKLIVNDDLWQEWKGQMPVIYNVNK